MSNIVHLTQPDHKGFVSADKPVTVHLQMIPTPRRPAVLQHGVILSPLVIDRERRIFSNRIVFSPVSSVVPSLGRAFTFVGQW